MKRNALELLAALVLAAFAAPAQGATYLNVDCYCDPDTEGNTITRPDGSKGYGCVCIQKYTLGKSSTKEFRFRCKSDNFARDVHYLEEYVADRDSATTCTIRANNTLAEYASQSCTNWSPLSADTLHLQTFCAQR